MSSLAKKTTDHDTIVRWAKERGGVPAVVRGTEKYGEGKGLLRINFPGFGDEKSLEKLAWDDFFETFDQKELAFLYQDTLRSGKTSRFFRFVSRDR